MNLKKLLSTIGIISATITGSLNIVACNHTKSDNSKEKSNNIEENKKETNKTNQINNIEKSKEENAKKPDEIKENKTENSIPTPPPLPPLIPVIDKIVSTPGIKRAKREINNAVFDEEIKQATAKMKEKLQIKKEIKEKKETIIEKLKAKKKYSFTFAQGIDNIDSLYTKINSKFISCHLNEEEKDYFNDKEFNLDKITIYSQEWNSWLPITETNLITEAILKTKFTFNYQKKDYHAELNINIISAEKYIINKIIENTYNLKIPSKTTSKDIEKQITNLIPTKISNEKIKKYLIENSNKLVIKNEIFNKDKKELSLNDLLKELSSFKATIKFSFNNVEAELPLIITIIRPENISNVLNQTNNKILNSDAQNITTVKKDTNLDTFKTNLSANIKKYYENSEITNIFNPEEFKITSIYKITKTNEKDKTKVKELKSKDFNNFQELELEVNYNYEKKYGKFMLLLTILPDLEDINSAIKNTTYIKKINIKTTINELKKSIDSKFISTSLASNIQKYFDEDKFAIEEINNSKNNPITQEDIIANTTLYINYSYDGIKEKTTLSLKKDIRTAQNKELQDELKETLRKIREAVAPKEE